MGPEKRGNCLTREIQLLHDWVGIIDMINYLGVGLCPNIRCCTVQIHHRGRAR